MRQSYPEKTLEVIFMRKQPRYLVYLTALILAGLFFISGLSAQTNYITPEEASKYIGKTKTVCGEVVSTNYAARSRGQPTFLNLDQPYPNQIFTVVIWGSERNKFKSPPEIFYRGKSVCVTGVIDTYRGKPQIIVRDPSQIVIKTD